MRRDGMVVTAERRACELLHAPDPDSLAGREWTSIIASPAAPDAREAGLTFASGGTWEGALHFRYAREEVVLSVSIAPVARSSELMVMSLQPLAERVPGTPATPPAESAATSLVDAAPTEPRPDDLKAVVAAYEAMLDLDDATAIARSVLQAIESAIGFDWAAVLRYTPGTPVGVEVVATYPSPMAGVARGVRWQPADPDEALVHSTGEPSLQGELRQRPEAASPLDRLPAFGLRSRILVPLYAGAGVAGALVLFRAGTLAFTPADGMLAERTVRRLGETLAPRAEVERREPPVEAYRPPASVSEPVYVPPIPEPPAAPQPAAEPIGDASPFDVGESRTLAPPPAEDITLVSSRLESLGELVAGVAHELNNPLTAILGYAQILGGLEDAEREHALRTIEDEAQRAARIVRNLLSFARQRPGQRRLVNVEEMLRRVIDLRRYTLEVDDVHVVTRLGLVREVEVDEGQFEQVFLNLLNNAQQALQGRGGEVTVSTWQNSDHIYIAFADDGPGVPEALRSRIFEPFFTTREVGRGQGMGLAIVYGVVTHHGGRAWVEGNPSGGATFVIELPLPSVSSVSSVSSHSGAARPHDNAEGAPPRSHLTAPAPPIAGRNADQPRRRVLVVDDEAPVRALTREILSATGFDVETAEDGDTALGLLSASAFDLVITDLKMPGMDGASLYQEVIRRWPALRDRVLFVTGDIEGEPAARSLDSSSIRYLQKPFTTRQLISMVQDVLGGQAAPQP